MATLCRTSDACRFVTLAVDSAGVSRTLLGTFDLEEDGGACWVLVDGVRNEVCEVPVTLGCGWFSKDEGAYWSS